MDNKDILGGGGMNEVLLIGVQKNIARQMLGIKLVLLLDLWTGWDICVGGLCK